MSAFDLPRTRFVHRPSGRYLNHVEPSRLDASTWYAGADWAAPTALDFSVTVLEARDVVVQSRPFGAEGGVPPQAIVRELEVMWRELRHLLAESGRVVDERDRQGVTFRHELSTLWTRLEARLVTWPAVEGATVPRVDRDPSAPGRWSR